MGVRFSVYGAELEGFLCWMGNHPKRRPDRPLWSLWGLIEALW